MHYRGTINTVQLTRDACYDREGALWWIVFWWRVKPSGLSSLRCFMFRFICKATIFFQWDSILFLLQKQISGEVLSSPQVITLTKSRDFFSKFVVVSSSRCQPSLPIVTTHWNEWRFLADATGASRRNYLGRLCFWMEELLTLNIGGLSFLRCFKFSANK